MVKKIITGIFLLMSSVQLCSQEIDYRGEVNFRGLGSNDEKLPFWMYSNQRGRVAENTNFSGLVGGAAELIFGPETSVEFGGGLLLQDGLEEDAVFIDELYAHFESPWIYLTAGRKQRRDLYNGISASNENILWSLNARPLPGLQIGTTEPVFFSNERGVGFEGSWNEYFMGKDSFVENARIHHKNLRIIYRTRTGFEVKAGLQHFAQWGGVSPRHGPQPDSFEDYVKVITGQEGGENATESDQLNALGNHLGGYEFYISKKFRDFYIELFYNHLFEDGSGRRLGNTPDGRYGIFIEKQDNTSLVHSVMYELFYTHHQSHTTTGAHKYDNYLNNGTYSAWAYKQRILGVPFFTLDEEGESVINNKFTAHHFGINGNFSNYFKDYPYKLLLSYARNDGTYRKRIRPNQDLFYLLYDMRVFSGFAEINVQLGAEYNSLASPIYGAGIHLVRRF